MINEEYQTEEKREEGFPVDLNEQEFLAFSLTVARKMGALRTQKPMIILFAVYFVVELAGILETFIETGELSILMLLMALLTIACAALSLTVMPARIKKSAKASFLMGNQNGYYGEITVTPYAIMKHIGDETVTVPFDEQSIYIEDKGFMAFTAAGQQRSIVLPARCMTAEMASQIRQAVFAPQVRIARRVFARMDAGATAPIAKRPFPGQPQTLYTLDFQYTEQETAKLFMDVAMGQFFRSLPGVAAMIILAGLLMAILQENAWWFPGISLTFLVGYLLIMVLNAKTRAKRTDPTETRTHIALTDRGIELRVSPSGMRMRIGWQGVERAVERETCVEFFHSGGNLLRIPKRVIDDFEEFRRVVDAYHTK